ncbi:hypothetical protein DL96DRAFT_540356 [Flagelloscypha sp. PMI_526]|nr:hypothetical protein DL96DRAFT_540356 [Flagelloscypha sp. PMI_526]
MSRRSDATVLALNNQSPNTMSGITLLSIDGGPLDSLGVLAQIVIIEDALSCYEMDNDLEENTVKLCDVFDLIVGTGTGALVGCMLGPLRMTTNEAKAACIQLIKSVFGSNTKTKKERADLLRRALEDILDTSHEEAMSKKTLREIGNLHTRCKFAITTMSVKNITSPVLFRAYRGRSRSVECTLLDALIATLADANAFPPITLKEGDIPQQFISTTTGHCNPIDDLLSEVSAVYRSSSIACIVSLGSGRPNPVAVNWEDDYARAFLDHATGCQSASERTEARFSRHPGVYVRLELTNLDLDARPDAETMIAHSRAYLRESVTCARLNELSESLKNRPNRLEVTQISGLEPGIIEGIKTMIENSQHSTILERLQVSRSAPFKSADGVNKMQRRECTKNTRVNILKRIESWAHQTEDLFTSSLFWIAGLAGTGKTTILQTICEQLDHSGLLASSYFCSIQLDSQESKRVIPTIVRHLASRYPSFAYNLVSQLQNDPDSAHSRLDSQFRELLCVPWHTACKNNAPTSPVVVVVDALEECDQGERILELILAAVIGCQLPGIKFLVTSRPSPNFMRLAEDAGHRPQIVLHEVAKEVISTDIEHFFDAELHGTLSPAEIRQLTIPADGLFIYASTLVKHLMPSEELSLAERKALLHQVLTPAPDEAKIGLDTLYYRILNDALSPLKVSQVVFRRRLHILQVIACTAEATTASVIADLLGIDMKDIMRVVRSLHSVLFVASEGDPIYVIHASFQEFIASRREAPFMCDVSFIHAQLTRSCLQHMRKHLKFNMCNIDSSFQPDTELESPIHSLGALLSYSCRHWWGHVKHCNEPAKNNIYEQISPLLEEKGIFWMEAMCLLGCERDCRDVLINLAFALSVIDKFPKTKHLALEAAAMISTFLAITPKTTSQLYLSILALSEGEMIDCWKSLFYRVPRIVSRQMDGLQYCKMTVNVKSAVYSVAISPSGKQVVSGSDDGTVRIWNTESGQQLSQSDGHEDSVNSVAFSPDGKQVVSASSDGTIRIWSAESGEQLFELARHNNPLTSAAFSPNGQHVVWGCSCGCVRIWNAESGKELLMVERHYLPVRSVSFSHDSRHIASGSDDMTVRIWNIESGKQLHMLNAEFGSVHSVAFSPDGKKIASAHQNEVVQIWSLESGEGLRELYGSEHWINSVSFSPDGVLVVGASHDRSVQIWRIESGEQLLQLNGHEHFVHSVAFSSDGKQIVSGSEDGTVRIWNVESIEQVNEANGHDDLITSVAFSPDGKQVASGSWDGSMRVWSAESGKQLFELNGHGNWVTSVQFSPNGKRLVSGGDDCTTRIWSGRSRKQLLKLNGHYNRIKSVNFSPDGKHVLSASVDGTIRVWSVKSGEELLQLSGHKKSVVSVAFSPNGKHVVSGSEDKTVRIWNSDSGELLYELNGHNEGVKSVAFSPKGDKVVSASTDGIVRIWSVKSGKSLFQIPGHHNSVTAAALSSDCMQIACASEDGTLLVWSTTSGQLLFQSGGHTREVTSVAFSLDGKRIVSGSVDRTVRIWDIEPAEGLVTLKGGSRVVTSVMFSDDEKRYGSESSDQHSSPDLPVHSDGREARRNHHSEYTLTQQDTICLKHTGTSYIARDDGWVVTSIERTPVEHRLFWLPPSLRPFHPATHLVLSKGGFNKIDVSGCTFGKGWSKIYRGGSQ